MITSQPTKRPQTQKMGDWREVSALEKAAVAKHGEQSVRSAYEKAGVDLDRPYMATTFKSKRAVLSSLGFATLPQTTAPEITELSVPASKPKLFVNGKVNLPAESAPSFDANVQNFTELCRADLKQGTGNPHTDEITKLEAMLPNFAAGSLSAKCLAENIAALKSK